MEKHISFPQSACKCTKNDNKNLESLNPSSNVFKVTKEQSRKLFLTSNKLQTQHWCFITSSSWCRFVDSSWHAVTSVFILSLVSGDLVNLSPILTLHLAVLVSLSPWGTFLILYGFVTMREICHITNSYIIQHQYKSSFKGYIFHCCNANDFPVRVFLLHADVLFLTFHWVLCCQWGQPRMEKSTLLTSQQVDKNPRQMFEFLAQRI